MNLQAVNVPIKEIVFGGKNNRSLLKNKHLIAGKQQAGVKMAWLCDEVINSWSYKNSLKREKECWEGKK